MKLNDLLPAWGSRPKKTRRRGQKTCGRGHKGQSARSGSSIPARREGGQTPLYRRLPKMGFNSQKALHHARLPLSVLNGIPDELLEHLSVDLLKALDLIPHSIKTVKIYLSGEEARPVSSLGNIRATIGVRSALKLDAAQ